MSRPRVLLVDDDASIRRFAAMALEDLEIDLTCVASVAEALATLRAEGPVALVLTDLMMPGESGLDLVRHLESTPALRGQARIVVFSADPDGGAGALAGHDVWRHLRKPVSVDELAECVATGVAISPALPRPAGNRPATGAMLTDAEAQAVKRHFGGERTLFVAFRALCLQQFERDLVTGQQAHERSDLAGLRHLAHSLKSVLGTLGHDDMAASARALERACAEGDAAAAASLWPQVAAGLADLPQSDRAREIARTLPPEISL